MPVNLVREYDVHPYVRFLVDRFDPYVRWVDSEGVPTLEGSFVADVRTMELGDWPRVGGRGAILRFSDQMVADGHVYEIGTGGSLHPQRHLFEEVTVIAQGRGATEVWIDGHKPHTFEWQAGSVFAIPLGTNYRHHNVSDAEVVRFFSLTNAPQVFELFRDPSFIFGAQHHFADRFQPDDTDFFATEGRYHEEYYGGIYASNFIPDIRRIKLVPRERRGPGNRNMYIHMAGGTMLAHVSEFPVGTYKAAHRHGPGAFIYMLDSTGYTLMWKAGEAPTRYDWQEGSVISPPAGYFHQHYNTGREPCRFVALHSSYASQREESGVEQIEIADEDDALRELYRRECEKNGVSPQM